MTTQPEPRLDPSIPLVYTVPVQEPGMVQPTLGRIAMGVFLGNLMTGVVVLLVWAIMQVAA